jgi:hypothetical protein
MSENSMTVVSLTEIEHASARAISVREWLIGSGVAMPNTRHDPLWQPSELMPSHAWRRAVEPTADNRFEQLANNGVDVFVERALHDPGENLEPPACPTCGTQLDLNRYMAFVDPWLESGEPRVGCDACSDTRLLGDWTAPWGYAVGAPAVCFNNWPPRTDTFLSDLRARVSDRTFVVRAHW